MSIWFALILAALAAAFLFLWRREVAWRMRDMLQARRRQREAEGQLKQHIARVDQIQQVSDVTSDLLLVMDREFHLQYANLAAREAFGELQRDQSLIAYTGDLELENLAREAMSLGEEEKVERVIHIDDLPYRAQALALPQGVGLALTNVTELQRLSRARQDMITNLSHELRTPLTSLKLLAETLLSPAGQDPEVERQLLGKMVSEVDQLHQMSEELLELSAIESGKQVMRLVPVALQKIVEGPMERLRDQAERRSVSIHVAIDPESRVVADPEQAARAVQNVLHNAIKFTPQGGEVKITSEPAEEQGQVVLAIADTGPGIPPEELQRVFERFYRSNWAWGTQGTGLGLAIARHIMQAHGGRIWAGNRALPQRGAVFYLAFSSV
jgi:two-component system phosphate regulon sensor histidine kinase PhoR